jgi:hypothetical protein
MIACILAAVPAFSSDRDEIVRPSLRGVRTVAVEMDVLQDNPQSGALIPEDLRTTIELRLRSAGIRVADDAKKADGMLVLGFRSARILPPAYLWRLDLWLWQAVKLQRDPNVQSIAKTWDTGYLGYAQEEGFKDSTLRYVNLAVDKFSNDYLAVNPK